jgi:hypothetical protein
MAKSPVNLPTHARSTHPLPSRTVLLPERIWYGLYTLYVRFTKACFTPLGSTDLRGMALRLR